MCGFLGILGPSASKYKEFFPTALRSIAHRGPDASGIWQSEDGLCILGHQRLSILDRSQLANQPFINADAVLVYNGEIYNHEICRRNCLKHNKFITSSDTESLFYLLLENNSKRISPKIFNKLEGMYAGGFYHLHTKELTLFRDQLGIKPLYQYVLPDSTVVFCSEIKGILSLLNFSKWKCNQRALNNYLLFENWPQGISLFEGINLINPGSVVYAQLGVDQHVRISTVKSDEILEDNARIPPTELCSYVLDNIATSIKSHLLSDVPLACYLSGGLDSALVTSIAAQSNANLLAFNGYFKTTDKDEWYDESNLATLIARAANVPLIKVEITADDFVKEFDRIIWALDEPRMGMGSFSQFIVAKEVAKHRKVILAGHGGDELFAGYPMFKVFSILEQLPKFKAIANMFKLNAKELPWFVYTLLGSLCGKSYFAPKLFVEACSTIRDIDEDNFYYKSFRPSVDELNKYYLNTYLPGLLMVEDKISMFHSLETRLPLWSQVIYNNMQQIPIATKLLDGQLKGLLKKVCSSLLPKKILQAPKRGFPTPLRHWFRKELKEYVHHRLIAQDSPVHELVIKTSIQKLLQQHESRKLPFALDEKRAHKIWMLLCLDSWARQYGIEW